MSLQDSLTHVLRLISASGVSFQLRAKLTLTGEATINGVQRHTFTN